MNIPEENYREATEWLFTQIPAFHRIGAGAYKPGLDRTLRLSKMFGNPHRRLRTIHVAGTNGKGSVSSSIASVLRAAGYRTGLFTSPHLVDFRERIRVDGRMISEAEVVDFVSRYRKALAKMAEPVEPSFFELTTIMAFEHFVRAKVDIAVIEVGLGGRLDSTNIITPDVSVITNIGLDHTALLGDTLAAIAGEKAGIIKPGVEVVAGRMPQEALDVVRRRAAELGSPLWSVVDEPDQLLRVEPIGNGAAEGNRYVTRDFGEIVSPLGGEVQEVNLATVLAAVGAMNRAGLRISVADVVAGIRDVCRSTGLIGRWTRLPWGDDPCTICDTGHNPDAWQYIVPQLNSVEGPKVAVVGFAADKDVDSVLELMRGLDSATTRLIFTEPDTERRLPAESLRRMAAAHGLEGEAEPDLAEAYKKALAMASAMGKGSTVFVGGSNFVVARLLVSGRQ